MSLFITPVPSTSLPPIISILFLLLLLKCHTLFSSFFFSSLFSFLHPSQEKERRYLKFQGVENRSLLLPFVFCFACECKIGLRGEQDLRYTPEVSVPIAGGSKQESQITQGHSLSRHMIQRTFPASQPRLPAHTTSM